MLIVFVSSSLFFYNKTISEGKTELKHFSRMYAEHITRAVEAVDLLSFSIVSNFAEQTEWHKLPTTQVLAWLIPPRNEFPPQLRAFSLTDTAGYVQVDTPKAPRFSRLATAADFAALIGEKETYRTVWQPAPAPNTTAPNYVIGYRVNNKYGQTDGVLLASLQLSYFEKFCAEQRLDETFEVLVLNKQGIPIISCSKKATPPYTLPSDLQKQIKHTLSQLQEHPEKKEEWHHANGYLFALTKATTQDDLFVFAGSSENRLLHLWHLYNIIGGLVLILLFALLIGSGFILQLQFSRLQNVNYALDEQQKQLLTQVQYVTRELQRKREIAEAANASKSRFLAAAAHDLRQPMAALSMFNQSLGRHVEQGALKEIGETSNRIKIALDSLTILFTALLDFSCLETERPNRPFSVCDLGQLFSSLENTFAFHAHERGLRFKCRPNKLLPLTEPIALERLLVNLISNAIKYTEQGGVVVAARKRGQNLHIEVIDTGIGIPESETKRIFEEFYQVNNRAREYQKGLGLGLAIVGKLTLALRAELKVYSKVKRGSRFVLILPNALAHTPENLQAAPRTPDNKPKQFMLIGSTPAMNSISHNLKAWGYSVKHLPDLASLAHERETQALATVLDLSQYGRLEILALPEYQTIIALGKTESELPAWVHVLSTPIRPARLRALVQHLVAERIG